MTERTSWRCTGCCRVHAPHVDTCPEGTLADVMFPMTPENMRIVCASAAGDRASPKPSPDRYRRLMNDDIDA